MVFEPNQRTQALGWARLMKQSVHPASCPRTWKLGGGWVTSAATSSGWFQFQSMFSDEVYLLDPLGLWCVVCHWWFLYWYSHHIHKHSSCPASLCASMSSFVDSVLVNSQQCVAFALCLLQPKAFALPMTLSTLLGIACNFLFSNWQKVKVVFAIWVHSLGQIKPVLLQSSLKPVQQSDFFLDIPSNWLRQQQETPLSSRLRRCFGEWGCTWDHQWFSKNCNYWS